MQHIIIRACLPKHNYTPSFRRKQPPAPAKYRCRHQIYFVDDEPVIEEQEDKPQVNRLVYKKDE